MQTVQQQVGAPSEAVISIGEQQVIYFMEEAMSEKELVMDKVNDGMKNGGPTLNDVCREIVDATEGMIGCGVIDIDSGLVLGYAHDIKGFSESYVEAVAAAAVDLFRGRTISAVESLIGSHFGNKVTNSIQEIQVTTGKSFQFMSVVPGKPNALFVMVTDRNIKLGLGWTLLRASLSQVAPACP